MVGSRRKTVDRSTLRLSEVARHVVIPEGIVDTLWFEVEERCREWGDTFDVWQDGLGQVTLGIRGDGLWAATVGGVTFSIPRQVAKTFIVGRIVIALCTLFPGLTVLWTAHRIRTTTNTFQKMKAVCLRPGVRPYLAPGRNLGTAIRDANGEQEIPFANGSRILFGAREQGFGRGFDEVDIIVFDEAQILTEKALEDMIAATNQSRWVHGALLFYMGTPPRRGVDPGEVFTGRRAEALALKGDRPDFGEPVASGDAVYVECSADAAVGQQGGPSLDDPRQVELANPSYPHRTPDISVKRLRKNLPSDDGWRREGLGVWDVEQGEGIFPKWGDCLDRGLAQPDDVPAIGLAGSSDGLYAAIGAASLLDDGRVAVAPVGERKSGQRWLVEEAARIQRERDCAVVVDERGPLSYLIPALEEAGIRLTLVGTSEWCDACGSFWQAVEDGRLAHTGDADLSAAVRAASWRPVGDRRAFGRKSADISMLEAVTLAAHVARMAPAGFNVW